MAQLKPQDVYGSHDLTKCLHGFIAVAQLKHPSSRLTLTCIRGLHGFIAVAQLKPELTDEKIEASTPSPRLHRRGPIEAPGQGYGVRQELRSLHGFIAVAQLKLPLQRRDKRCFLECLHGFIAVAQLKPWK